MLVITRVQKQTIRIGEDIVVKVIETSRGRVKIGIEAPKKTPIVRGELDNRTEAHANDRHV